MRKNSLTNTQNKRTNEALSDIIIETKKSIDYLETVSASIDIATSENDLKAIKDELIQTGYIKFKRTGKKEKIVNKPLHFISSDGFHMYVGKNNIQNETLHLKLQTVMTGGSIVKLSRVLT